MSNSSDLDGIWKELEKSVGGKLMRGSDERFILKKLPLGLRQLDDALNGGFAFDRVTLLVGEESAGKTLLAMLAMKQAQALGLPTVFIDVERTWTEDWARTVGIDPDEVIVSRPPNAEAAIDVLRGVIKTAPAGVVVLDSIAAMPPAKELDDETEKWSVGLQARLMNKAFRDVVPTNEGWCIIMVNQIREKVGIVYGSPETMPGGRGQKFAAWQIVRVRKGANIEEGTKDDKRIIGRMLRIKVEKNKQGPPNKEAEVAFYFTGEFDTVTGVVDQAIELGIIQSNPGGRYEWNGEKFHGKRSLRERFNEEEAMVELQMQLDAIDLGDSV